MENNQPKNVPQDSFTESELTILLETARIALSDGDLYDTLAEELDLSDPALKSLQEKLTRYLAGTDK